MNAAGCKPLPNPRHEVFARAVAQHGFIARAAREAGYADTSAGNSGTQLIKVDAVRARVDFIRNNKEVKATTKKELTKIWVIDRMREVAEEAIKNKEKAAAIKALELLGREVGAFVERKQLEVVSPLDSLPAAALLVLIENLTQPRGRTHDLDLIASDQTTGAPRPGDLELLGVDYEDMGQGNDGVTDGLDPTVRPTVRPGDDDMQKDEQYQGLEDEACRTVPLTSSDEPGPYQGADTAEQTENVEAPHPPLFGGPPSRSSTTVSKSSTPREAEQAEPPTPASRRKAAKAAAAVIYEALAPAPGAPGPGLFHQTGEEDFDDV